MYSLDTVVNTEVLSMLDLDLSSIITRQPARKMPGGGYQVVSLRNPPSAGGEGKFMSVLRNACCLWRMKACMITSTR